MNEKTQISDFDNALNLFVEILKARPDCLQLPAGDGKAIEQLARQAADFAVTFSRIRRQCCGYQG